MKGQAEQIAEQDIRSLIKDMINTKPNPKRNNLSKPKESPVQNEQIQKLDIHDYLQLLAHQKKHLSHPRWEKLTQINQSMQMEQESYKHFFTVASHSNYRRLEHPGYYKQLLLAKPQYPLSFFSSIEKDISRTLSSTNEFQQYLRNILCAYAIRNPSLLYCQGMNYIVAYLLINEMSQEQTFWFLACIVENILPDDYFKDLTTISIVSYIFNDILSELFPEFQLEMNDAGMDSSVILVPWFVCLFSKGFINSVSAYIINIILLESRLYRIGFILLKIALALITLVLTVQKSFYITKDFKTIKDTLELKVYEISLAQIQEAYGEIELDYEIYLQLEVHYRLQKKLAREQNLKARMGKKLPLPVCNKQYPICFHRIEMEKKIGSIEESLTLKNGLNIKSQIVHNYLDQDPSNEHVDISYNNIQQCLIGRHSHICHLQQEEFNNAIEDKRRNFNRETIAVEVANHQLDESFEQNTHLETPVERFAQLSGYFIVDEQYEMDENDEIYVDQHNKKTLGLLGLEYFNAENMECKQTDKQVPKPSPKRAQQQDQQSLSSIKAAVGNVWKKVLSKIQGFKQIRAKRLSQKQFGEEGN